MSDRVPTLKDVREHIERRLKELDTDVSEAGNDQRAYDAAEAGRCELRQVLAMLERVESGR